MANDADTITHRELDRENREPALGLSSLLESAILAKATALARDGRHEQAAALLEPMLEEGKTGVALLDLLARIRAQQGRVADARALWERALAIDPDNAACRKALDRCRAGRSVVRPRPTLAAVLVVATLVVLGLQIARLQNTVSRLETLYTSAAKAENQARAPGAQPPIRKPTPRPTEVVPVVYTVQRGDSLWSISHDVYGTPHKWQLIAIANNISRPYFIISGRKLDIPANR